MKLIKFVVPLVALQLCSGCALFNSIRSGNGVGAAQEAARLAAEAKEVVAEADRRAKAKCDPIRTAEVAFVEERAMGGVLGVGIAAKAGGLLLDGMTETAPDKLQAEVDAGKKITLPDSAKNDLTAYISVVGRNLAKYSERPDLPWTFAVIESETPNAFSAPGGYVLLTTGLLAKINNEAQLAGVLGHEIGHVVHKHAIKRYREAKADQCGVATAGGYVVGKGLQAAIDLLPAAARDGAKFAKDFENFDLDKSEGGFVAFVMDVVMALIELKGNEKPDEFQADATALQLVAFAGYDASEYEKFLTSLGSQGGGFSKHPSTEERVGKLKELREGELSPFATGAAKPDVSKPFAVIKPKS